MSKITQIPGNTPLNTIPSDYFPDGCGYWFEIAKGFDKGKKLFFRDTTHYKGNNQDVVLFVHGNPECSYSYRKVIKSLINKLRMPFRIINPDHIGFGLSDQASYQMVCSDHAENLLQLIKTLDLQNITMIIHDWGGPIGIGALVKEPKRLKNLVILNSSVFPISHKGLTYKNYPISWLGWARTPYVIPNRFWGDFASYALFVKRKGALNLLLNMLKYIILSELGIFPKDNITARKVYRQQLCSKQNVKSSKRLVLQSSVWAQGNTYKDFLMGTRDTNDFYKFIQNHISEFWGPKSQNIGVNAIIGGWDPLAKREVIEQWLDALPQLKGNIHFFPHEGHFIEEYRYTEIANSIIQLLV